jgi:hypothetical protein
MSSPASPASGSARQCTHVADCALFPLFRSREALAYWREHYCEGDHTRCARYQSMCDGRTPPSTLLPNGKLL